MKRILLSVLTVAICVTTATAQSTPKADTPHRVGLIDMAKVFQDYQKFKDMRDQLKTEIERSDAQAKKLAGEVQRLQGELQGKRNDSPNYAQLEKALLKARSDFEAYRAGEQRDLMRRESQIYKQIYVEVVDAVKAYASYANYTLVIRFSAKGPQDTETPQQIVDSMNRQVVYHRPSDDITEMVLNYLNRQYGKSKQASAGSAPSRSAARPSTSGTRRP